MEEQGEDLTPFWVQSSNTTADHRRRRTSSFFLNSGVLITLLLVTAILFIFFIIPSILSFSSQIFRPNLVKKSWDSLNILLVLVAIVFAFLSRNRNEDNHHNNTSFGDEDQRTFSNLNQKSPKSNSSTPRQWYHEYSDRTAGMVGLRRNSSSYPDLREVSPADDRWRFFDDTYVDSYQMSDSGRLQRRYSRREVEGPSSDTKTIHVDTFLSLSKEKATDAPTPSSPPPPPISTVKERPKRPHQSSVAQKERTNEEVNIDSESKKLLTPPVKQRPKRTYQTNENDQVTGDSESKQSLTPPAVPPPPPPPLPELHYYSEKSRKRDGGNATKEFWTSLYNKKKKKQRRRSVENFEDLLRPQPPSTMPPPPQPPPPPSVFHNLFSSKKNKHKRSHSDPPPEMLHPAAFTSSSRASKTTTQKAPVTAHSPPIPVTITNFNSVDENSNTNRSGGESPLIVSIRPAALTRGESPLIPIPPPPPPPPFKMPAWKFVVQGDYVRVQSFHSSRSGSPDLDDVESPPQSSSSGGGGGGGSSGGFNVMDGGDSMMFCPSPDVDTKADNFIARFRAGLKLEKNNSINRKQELGLSNLGPSPEINPNTTVQ